MIKSDNGSLLCEMQAHSRQVSALVCHPVRSVFATVSDDTFLNVWEVTGLKLEINDVQLIISQRISDMQLTGVQFATQTFGSVVATTYDYKSIIIMEDVI